MKYVLKNKNQKNQKILNLYINYIIITPIKLTYKNAQKNNYQSAQIII